MTDIDLRSGFEECYRVLGDDEIVQPNAMPERSFRDKLVEFDENAGAAVRFLIDWLRQDGDVLVALAKGRLARGHYQFGDSLMYEYDGRTLEANAAEELADAINYVQRLLAQRGKSDETG